ncbi:MAG: hypothetical protein NUV73_01595 [Candidatus Daviesbacteria bacterium]|nr:hypothetical protein [Candidatus Daviesbacteria bacterium]
MEITINPSNILGWIGIIGVIVSVIIFVIYQVRRNDLKLLRDSVSDLGTRVDFLEKENVRLKEDLINKSTDYDNLKFKKNYLKQIILESLNMRKDIQQTIVEK